MNNSAACAAISDQGFAILPVIFSAEFLDYTLAEIGKLSPRRSRAGVRHALSLDPVSKVAHCPQLIRLASSVLGADTFPFRATLFEKTSTANWLVVWHQDTALPLRERRQVQGWGPWSVKESVDYAHAPAAALAQVLALRVHFDDSSSDNGPLRVLPGTHQSGVLNDDQIHDLATRVTPIDCVVAKGGVVAMRPLIVHASSKSQIELPRRVLHVEFAASESIASPLQLAVA